MKVSYKKIRTNIEWDEFGLLVLGKEELDANHVWTILWNAQLEKKGIVNDTVERGLPF